MTARAASAMVGVPKPPKTEETMSRWISGNEMAEMLWPLGEALGQREAEATAAPAPENPDALADALVGRIMEEGSLECVADAPIEEVIALKDRFTQATTAWLAMGDAGVMRVPSDAPQREVTTAALFQLHGASRDQKTSPH